MGGVGEEHVSVHNLLGYEEVRMPKVHILLREDQIRWLKERAHQESISMSAYMRRILDQYRKMVEEEERLRRAAEKARRLYAQDPELTVWRALDAEPFWEP